jgi:hypothetical protein
VRWGVVIRVILAVLFGTTLVISLWYYLAIILPNQASHEAQAQVDAMYAKVWAAYCHGEPYPTERIAAFCTNPSMMPSP